MPNITALHFSEQYLLNIADIEIIVKLVEPKTGQPVVQSF